MNKTQLLAREGPFCQTPRELQVANHRLYEFTDPSMKDNSLILREL